MRPATQRGGMRTAVIAVMVALVIAVGAYAVTSGVGDGRHVKMVVVGDEGPVMVVINWQIGEAFGVHPSLTRSGEPTEPTEMWEKEGIVKPGGGIVLFASVRGAGTITCTIYITGPDTVINMPNRVLCNELRPVL